MASIVQESKRMSKMLKRDSKLNMLVIYQSYFVGGNTSVHTILSLNNKCLNKFLQI